MTAESFAKLTNVSRETLDRLCIYVDLLTSWNRRINLVGRNTIGDVWRRHILDSAQLYPLIPAESRCLVDLGSGAGLPGLVLSIFGVPNCHLIDSDGRKAAFLREAIRVTNADATVHLARLDRAKAPPGDVVTARALAPLAQIVEISQRFLKPGGVCLFLKGRNVEEELTELATRWQIPVERRPSLSDPSGSIIRLEAIACDPHPHAPRSVHS
ncbi:MAG TPA: 16S rRNA (guanine(527)-N(7))-methyltransferase RsmG [Stellaceae bacterium]|nr:16S rRNA (guanine(527)-N(7))-methyltransferase RsmG [Stellaceae bacterium]